MLTPSDYLELAADDDRKAFDALSPELRARYFETAEAWRALAALTAVPEAQKTEFD